MSVFYIDILGEKAGITLQIWRTVLVVHTSGVKLHRIFVDVGFFWFFVKVFIVGKIIDFRILLELELLGVGKTNTQYRRSLEIDFM